MLHNALHCVALDSTTMTHKDLQSRVHRRGRGPLVVEWALVHAPTGVFLARLTTVRFEKWADLKDRPHPLSPRRHRPRS